MSKVTITVNTDDCTRELEKWLATEEHLTMEWEAIRERARDITARYIVFTTTKVHAKGE